MTEWVEFRKDFVFNDQEIVNNAMFNKFIPVLFSFRFLHFHLNFSFSISLCLFFSLECLLTFSPVCTSKSEGGYSLSIEENVQKPSQTKYIHEVLWHPVTSCPQYSVRNDYSKIFNHVPILHTVLKCSRCALEWSMPCDTSPENTTYHHQLPNHTHTTPINSVRIHLSFIYCFFSLLASLCSSSRLQFSFIML